MLQPLAPKGSSLLRLYHLLFPLKADPLEKRNSPVLLQQSNWCISYKWLIGTSEPSCLLPDWFSQRSVALSHFLPHKFPSSQCWVLNIYGLLTVVSECTEHRGSLRQNYEVREMCLQSCLSNSHLLQMKKCVPSLSPTTALLELFSPSAFVTKYQ